MSVFSAIIVFVLLVFLLTMVLANAAPWVPTRRRDMERILALAKIKPGEVFYDLGCGDGRLLVAAARALKPFADWDETHRRQNAPERYREGVEIFNRRNPKHAIKQFTTLL